MASESTPPIPSWSRLHIWQIQFVRDLLILAAVMGVIYIGYQIRMVTVPLLLALALAYLFEPLVRWVTNRRLCTRPLAAVAIISISALVIAVPITLGIGFGVVQGIKATTEFAGNIAKVQKSVASPADEALRDAIHAGAWRNIRDFLAPPPSPPLPPPASLPLVPGTAPGMLSPGPEPDTSMLDVLGTRDEARALGQRVLSWLNAHAGDISASLGKRVATGGADAARAAFSTFTSIGKLIFQAGLTAIFFYFAVAGWGRVLDFSERFIPEARKDKVLAVTRQMDRVIAGFVRGRVTICLILAMVMTILYWLAGVPAPLILGPMIGLLFIVPYVHVIGVPIAMLLMWLEGVTGPIFAPNLAAGAAGGGAWWIIAAPIAVYVCAQVLDDWVLTPTIQGKTTDLAMPTIVFASLAGGALAGVYGLLLAIPAAACLNILAKELFWPRIAAWAKGEAADVLPIGRE